mmetsp:Transcript_40321/g.38793  ORF Transcript_40321/g.38793 Transcript_40321/m.38793 type:complete len:124 (+) Transcript_40321:103-474(+)
MMDEMRSYLVYCMKLGSPFVFFISKIEPDFKKEFNIQGTFPTDLIFNFQEFRKRENYLTLVKDEEDLKYFNIQEHLDLQEPFTIVILSTYTDDASMQKVMDNIPNLDNFQIFKVYDEPAITKE